MPNLKKFHSENGESFEYFILISGKWTDLPMLIAAFKSFGPGFRKWRLN